MERALFLVAAALLLTPAQAFAGGYLTNTAGLLLFGALAARHWMRRGPAPLPVAS
jgi:hypothetical protein